MSSETPGFLQRLLFAQESPQFSKLSCQNLSKGTDLPHVFTIKLHVTLHLKLKREASLARRLLEDIDFAAFFWCLCIKTSFKVLVKGRYCWADSGFMLCFSFLSGFLRSICPTCLRTANTGSKWTSWSCGVLCSLSQANPMSWD